MDIVELTEKNMLDYSGAVNQARAIPDARTGLKPIHRKILYEMYADKIRSTGKYRKCAYMVGQIIARFSEHGDAATYDALVRLAQPWIQRYPLLDFHGNYGSPFGDSSAAMRYTESKLSKIAEDGMLMALDKENVDWIPNFTNDEEEPITLPSVFPGLFCLPNQGIGYACACNFLTYNLKEVAEAVYAYIDGNEIPVLNYDLASGGTVINPSIMPTIQKTGKGSVVVEASYKINGNKIIITELPFNVMFDDVMDNIVSLIENEEITNIANIENNSGNGKMEMIITAKTGFTPQVVLENLMSKTKLRSSYGVNQVALVDNKPTLLSFEDMLSIYVSHNLSCIKREFEFDYKKTLERLHILEGLLIATGNIDEVIQIIRHGDNPKEQLMSKYTLDEEQVKAILDMKLSRIQKLEIDKLIQEREEKSEFAKVCDNIISNESEQKVILKDRLGKLVEKYGDNRRTKISEKEIVKTVQRGGKTVKEKAAPENVVVVVNKDGYVKVIPAASYRKTMNELMSTKTLDNDMLRIYTNKGLVYRIQLKSLKKCANTDKGTALGSICEFDTDETILSADCVNGAANKKYIVFVSASGKVKKSLLSEFDASTRTYSGTKCMGIKDDEVISIYHCDGNETITLKSNEKKAICFEISELSEQGKAAGGVKGINTTGQVVETSIGNKYGLPITKRGGKGKLVK